MRTWSLVCLFGALTISIPCAATDAPSVPIPGSSDYAFLKMEKDLPGFGGMFMDGNGAVNVYMLHPKAMQPEVETHLAAHPSLLGGKATAAINVLQGQYSFSALAGWRDRLLPALVFKGFVFLDIDETRNRLVIGVSDHAAIPVVTHIVRASKIPQKAVIIDQAEPFHNLTTVNEQIRPVLGGVQINDGGKCTLGFNAILDGINGFVTASHCTTTQGHPDGTRFQQPELTFMPYIGTELKDPDFFTLDATHPTCPAGDKCRYSDSAFARYDSGIGFTLGAIARTDETWGSHVIDQPNPLIISKEECGGVGDVVQKVGSTTGWTTGKIVKTCITAATETPGITMLPCQNAVVPLDAKAAADIPPPPLPEPVPTPPPSPTPQIPIATEGDSGSPVFLKNADGTVSLAGILWEGTNTPSFVYSCIGSVKADLGQQLITYQPPLGQPMITDLTFPSSITGDSKPNDGTVTFTDSDGGINWAQFDVVQATCRDENPDCFPSFGFDPGVSNLTNGQFTFNMWCEGDFYWSIEATLRDAQGHVSNPWMFSVKCNPVSARAAPITRALSVRSRGGGL